jgi:hypothetical protein
LIRAISPEARASKKALQGSTDLGICRFEDFEIQTTPGDEFCSGAGWVSGKILTSRDLQFAGMSIRGRKECLK